QDAFHRLLSCCHALESLYMAEVRAAGCLRVSSPTITTIIFRHSSSEKTELVIEDAPCLLRLLLTGCNRDDCVTVRVISAPNLKILGPFLVVVSKLLLFQVAAASSCNLAFGIHTCRLYFLCSFFLFSSGNKLSQLHKLDAHLEGFGSQAFWR
uniref:F-box/LRR-repeat protein 15/At3g58940/PEG3-like LRR domain-containing protein n=1 Tax=Aegilops tauschii subsp. strangulata TaxID=200361 RepID=A0A453N3B7_AEGTS